MAQTASLYLNPFRNDKQNKIATSWRKWRKSCTFNFIIHSDKLSQTNNLYSERLRYRNGTWFTASSCRPGLETVRSWIQLNYHRPIWRRRYVYVRTKSKTNGCYGVGEQQAFLPTIPLPEYTEAHESSSRCQQRSHQVLVMFITGFMYTVDYRIFVTWFNDISDLTARFP